MDTLIFCCPELTGHSRLVTGVFPSHFKFDIRTIRIDIGPRAFFAPPQFPIELARGILTSQVLFVPTPCNKSTRRANEFRACPATGITLVSRAGVANGQRCTISVDNCICFSHVPDLGLNATDVVRGRFASFVNLFRNLGSAWGWEGCFESEKRRRTKTSTSKRTETSPAPPLLQTVHQNIATAFTFPGVPGWAHPPTEGFLR